MVDPARRPVTLLPLILGKRVILCVGSGGVGKTTTSAALGLAAAMNGKRTLCLTIDPAQRLAQSLGLSKMTTEEQRVDVSRFAEAGLLVTGSLTVMMLDAKRTFDDLVIRYASTIEAADAILANKLYRYISTSFSGSREYMAMEKLYELKDNPGYDLIILDTPPTANALDFLDAPTRMGDALDSSMIGWFSSAFESSGKLGLNLLARSTSLVLRAIGKFTGSGFLDTMGEFVTRMNELFGGFKQRAAAVSEALRGDEVAYVLVTSPDPMSIREIVYFADRLRQWGMQRHAVVVNRVHPTESAAATEEAVARRLESLGIQLGPGGTERVLRAAQEEGTLGQLDAQHLRALGSDLRDASSSLSGALRVDVPAFGRDVYDLPSLHEVALRLLGRQSAPG